MIIWIFSGGLASLNDQVYVIGGSTKAGTGHTRVDRYDPYANRWSTVSSMDQPRTSMGKYPTKRLPSYAQIPIIEN